ncbi:MAG: hydrolase 1, exosortase A system-associated [Pseudomonadota bacterium]|nr:hydrolase 1, exosortase A system-associated [Pseudomonadota bacterium]
MTRLPLTFGCGSLTLAGTLDTAPGQTGLLIVSGGNEIRSGAFGGQARLAARVAAAGFPCFRFDRRGIGDSEGENRGFRSSAKDIASAREAFLAMAPDVERVFAFGNCDAASALMLAGGEGFDGLILSNPWTIEDSGDDANAPPPAAIRERYAAKLKDPSEIARLLRGGVDLKKLARGLFRSVGPAPEPTSLCEEMRAGLDSFDGKVKILLAEADRTAQMFESGWDTEDPRIKRCAGATHAYVDPEHFDWLSAQIITALRKPSTGKLAR